MEYVYAALLLHSAGDKVTEDSVKKVLTAAGVKVRQGVLGFMTHLNQVGQTGATPRHPERPFHVLSWRGTPRGRLALYQRAARDQSRSNCGWARGKADVLYVADAFEVMAKVIAAANLDIDEWEKAEELLPELEKKARTPSNFALLAHTKARILYARGDLEGSKQLLKKEIASSRNVIPNLGLLVQVHCALFDNNYTTFPAIASVELKEAENALKRISELDPSNDFIENLRRTVSDRQVKQRPITRNWR